MIKVLLADSHPVVRIGITKILQNSSSIAVVGAVSSIADLFHAIEKCKPDVVLLELDFPEQNGITALKRLKKDFTHVKVLIFSANPEDVYALSTLKAGASGYLSKAASVDALEDAIQKIMNGGIYITEDLAQHLSVNNEPKKLFRKLSTREIEVLKLLVNGQKNKQIAKALDLNEKTVSTYKARLMKKLNVSNFVDMLQQAQALDIFS
ncbi:response regulator [Zhouia sp. PK063]|uniref:response regulator n=1 Tax=Zhouia sp. PK063 TaxID=3373602 RepID=UPI0037BDE3C7